MSLRARIFLLFLGFSVLPVVFLGAGDYFQSLEALRAVLQARSDALAEQAARELETAHGQIAAALNAASGVAESGDPVGPFTSVTQIEGTAEPALPTCGPGATVPVSAPPKPGRSVAARLPVETLRSMAPTLGTGVGEAGFIQVLSRETGGVLYDSRCAAGKEGITAASLSEATTVGEAARSLKDGYSHRSIQYEVGEATLLASVSAAGPAWAVAVSTSADEFITPFRRARIYYLALVLLVMGIAGAGFLLLAEGAFRSLRLVTNAADQIELGNLRPWLPPPGDDEVGRLSVAFRRMTERLEESVRKAELNQKLAAVGELATYLSHEIRNPLSSIRLSLQSLHRDVKSGFVPSDSPRVIEIALNEVKRLDGVVRAVLEMGRPVAAAERSCGAHEVLAETLDVLRPKVEAQGIELVYVPNAGFDQVCADPGGLRSTLINLVVNAMDALEGREDPRIRISTWSGQEELHIRIADNGPGVEPAALDSIFEPFFTTKASGNGIGLPTALRTVQAWDGTIIHEPVAGGNGAVFVIKLKLADAPEAEPAEDTTLTTAHA